MNVNNSKVMIFLEGQKNDFGRPYRTRIEGPEELAVSLKGEKIEKVDEFKYLCSVFCKDVSMEGKMRESCPRKKGYCIPGKDDEGEDGKQGC